MYNVIKAIGHWSQNRPKTLKTGTNQGTLQDPDAFFKTLFGWLFQYKKTVLSVISALLASAWLFWNFESCTQNTTYLADFFSYIISFRLKILNLVPRQPTLHFEPPQLQKSYFFKYAKKYAKIHRINS